MAGSSYSSSSAATFTSGKNFGDGYIRISYQTHMFTASAGNQSFMVPQNVYSMSINVSAGAGGAGIYGTTGGNSSRVFVRTVPVSPGDIFVFTIGQMGQSASRGSKGGLPGGGDGDVGYGGGGGRLTLTSEIK